MRRTSIFFTILCENRVFIVQAIATFLPADDVMVSLATHSGGSHQQPRLLVSRSLPCLPQQPMGGAHSLWNKVGSNRADRDLLTVTISYNGSHTLSCLNIWR